MEVDELDAAWFGAGFGVDIDAVEVLDAHSGTTGRARVALHHDHAGVPASVFVKLAPFDANQRSFVDEQGMGVAEARFYAELAPEIPMRIPQPWWSAHDDARRYVMVLEDLVAAGAREPHQSDPGLAVLIDGIIDAFAALHARFWESERFVGDGDLAWIERRTRGYGGGGRPFVAMAIAAFGPRMPPEFLAFAEFYCEHAEAIAPVIAAGPKTLVHGDAHLGNMFAFGDAPGFLDWAVIGCAPGMRDVAYFLCNSVPTELRRAEQQRWIDRYCSALAAAGVNVDPAATWDDYRLQAVTGWVAAACTAGMGARWQPEHIGIASTERANATVADLDTLALLRERISRAR